MKNNINNYIFICLIISCIIACLIPYPVFKGTSILNASEQKFINDLNENEIFQVVSSPNVKIINTDWFNGGNELFEKYQKARIIDIETQKSFYVYRTGGYYHADIETIDETNTNIFKSIYGNEWSWLRRPVLVEINNCYLAGSINGMPHGYTTVENNKEGGHTCVHLLNSKTHGTQRVDEAHQNAVEIASKSYAVLYEYLKIN